MSDNVVSLMEGSFVTGLLIVLGVLVLFLVMRQIVLWYWRINDLIDSTNKIAEQLGNIAHSLDNFAPPTPPKGSIEAVMTQLKKEQPY